MIEHLKEIAKAIPLETASRKRYFVEMLLFLAAPTKIIEDIKRSVTVTINVEP
jgi:hypothetical protein